MTIAVLWCDREMVRRLAQEDTSCMPYKLNNVCCNLGGTVSFSEIIHARWNIHYRRERNVVNVASNTIQGIRVGEDSRRTESTVNGRTAIFLCSLYHWITWDSANPTKLLLLVV